MPRSIWFLLAAVIAACAILLGLRSCGSAAVRTDGASVFQPSSASTTGQPADTAQASTTDAADAARASAMRDAVSTLHRYMGALPGERARADAFWTGGKPPADTGEADLRTLQSPRGIRLQNSMPTFLGASDDALEIPVIVRVSLADTSTRHYRGWYRLRRAISGDRWEITSASVDPEHRRE